MLLADYRMPEMSGIEFLEQAMDIFPRARRALLTAYADTDAAIAAINVVDVDHYLLKPWEPPEEKLYPVVDAMIDAYERAPDIEVGETKVIGHRWSAPSFEVRDFLARNAVPYRWFASDEPEGERLLAAAGVGADRLPVVITPDGHDPGRADDGGGRRGRGAVDGPGDGLLRPRRRRRRPGRAGRRRLRRVGGAADTLLVERQATGGQAGQSSRIENYLGFPDGVSGAQLTDRARRQATKFGAEILTTRDVVELCVDGAAQRVSFGDGTQVRRARRGHRDRGLLPRAWTRRASPS